MKLHNEAVATTMGSVGLKMMSNKNLMLNNSNSSNTSITMV